MIDMNSADSANHVSVLNVDDITMDRNDLEYYTDMIKNQYMSFNNIGTNLLKNIEDNYQMIILEEMINYCDDNYLSIIVSDDSSISPLQALTNGQKIYEFLIIDCLNTIIPNYMNSINCIDVDQFDLYLRKILKNDASNFKTSFLKAISSMLNELLKLQKLDVNVIKDVEYNNACNKYSYYIELVNYGDSNNFLNNFFRPILYKYNDEIQWRLL